MKHLFRYGLLRYGRSRALWGCLLLLAVLQPILESLYTTIPTAVPEGAWLYRLLSADAQEGDFWSVCLTASRMSLGAVYLLLGTTLGASILLPAQTDAARLPIAAAGYGFFQQHLCCVLQCLLFSLPVFLAALGLEALVPGMDIDTLYARAPGWMLAAALLRLLSALGNVSLGMLLCLILRRAALAMPVACLFLTAETLPHLAVLGRLLPTGCIPAVLLGPGFGPKAALYLLEGALCLILCILFPLPSLRKV